MQPFDGHTLSQRPQPAHAPKQDTARFIARELLDISHARAFICEYERRCVRTCALGLIDGGQMGVGVELERHVARVVTGHHALATAETEILVDLHDDLLFAEELVVVRDV
jgi:hypothetical protein